MIQAQLVSISRRLCGALTLAGMLGVLLPLPAAAELGEPEKDELKFGFIKLTDMAPLAVAYENGYFEDEGLYVTLEAQANWKVLLDGVIDGQLDGAHMLAGQDLVAGSGVCALLGNEQVALFYLPDEEQAVYALANRDPVGGANVLSRGIVGDIAGQLVVASPLYKQHFNLFTGACLEDEAVRVQVYSVRLDGDSVLIGRC